MQSHKPDFHSRPYILKWVGSSRMGSGLVGVCGGGGLLMRGWALDVVGVGCGCWTRVWVVRL